jgi:hypothetical protein
MSRVDLNIRNEVDATDAGQPVPSLMLLLGPLTPPVSHMHTTTGALALSFPVGTRSGLRPSQNVQYPDAIPYHHASYTWLAASQ